MVDDVEAEFGPLAAQIWQDGVSVQTEPECVATALLPFEPDTAGQARALHAHRELAQAFDFGFALLDAFDLPPLALDVIDDAIANLDALDAPREDLETSLGWTESGPRFCGDYQDCELDTADYEHSLGAP